jgi:hypothetical protein
MNHNDLFFVHGFQIELLLCNGKKHFACQLNNETEANEFSLSLSLSLYIYIYIQTVFVAWQQIATNSVHISGKYISHYRLADSLILSSIYLRSFLCILSYLSYETKNYWVGFILWLVATCKIHIEPARVHVPLCDCLVKTDEKIGKKVPV